MFILSTFAVIGLTNPVLADTTNQNATMPTIIFSTMTETTDTLQNMVSNFNANFSTQYGFKVQLDSSLFSTANQHDTYVSA